MSAWKVWWSLVLTLTVTAGVFAWKAVYTAWNAFFGTASEALEPSETVPEAAPLVEDEDDLLELHAARVGSAATPAAPSRPFSMIRRSTVGPWKTLGDSGDIAAPCGTPVEQRIVL